MFDLPRRIRNLFFFDSHGLWAAQTEVRSFYETSQRSSFPDVLMRNSRSNNGIHICLTMRRLITTEVVRSVGYLSGSRHEKYRNCKWLYTVTAPYTISNRDSSYQIPHSYKFPLKTLVLRLNISKHNILPYGKLYSISKTAHIINQQNKF